VLHGSIQNPRREQRLVDAAVVERDVVRVIQCQFFAVLYLAVPGARLCLIAHNPGREARLTLNRLFECSTLTTRSRDHDIVRYLLRDDFCCFPVVCSAPDFLDTRTRVPSLRIFGIFSVLQNSVPIISCC
jgi:hypothetical protein